MRSRLRFPATDLVWGGPFSRGHRGPFSACHFHSTASRSSVASCLWRVHGRPLGTLMRLPCPRGSARSWRSWDRGRRRVSRSTTERRSSRRDGSRWSAWNAPVAWKSSALHLTEAPIRCPHEGCDGEQAIQWPDETDSTLDAGGPGVTFTSAKHPGNSCTRSTWFPGKVISERQARRVFNKLCGLPTAAVGTSQRPARRWKRSGTACPDRAGSSLSVRPSRSTRRGRGAWGSPKAQQLPPWIKGNEDAMLDSLWQKSGFWLDQLDRVSYT